MPTLKSLQKELDELKRQNRLIIDSLKTLTAGYNNDAQLTQVIQEVESRREAKIAAVPEEKIEPAVPAEKKMNEAGLEEKIGKKWFAFIGIFALVVGIGFFVKYLSDNGFLGPVARMTMGFIAGISLIVIGEIASRRQRYAKWGKVLVGGGLAAIYFLVYAAYNFTEYRQAIGITQGWDIFFLGIVALITVGFSLKDNLQIVAAEAFMLGLFTCLLSSDFGYLMLVYNLFLAVAMAAVVVYKKWPLLGLAAIFGTFIIYFVWRQDNNDFSVGAMFLGAYFLCYILQSAFVARQDKNPQIENRVIISGLANSILFFFAGLELVEYFYPAYDAVFCLGLSIFHLACCAIAYFSGRKKISQVYFYLGAAFLAIAIPLYFEKSLITITWSILALVLLASYLKTNYRPMEYFYYCLSFVIGWRILLFDSRLGSFSWDNLGDSARALSFCSAAICFYLGYFLIARAREKISAGFEELVPYFYAILPTFILAILPLLEGGDNSQFLTIYWSALFAVLLAISAVKRFAEFRTVALIVGLAIFAKMLFYDLIFMDGFSHVAEEWRLLAYLIGIVLLYAGYILNLRQKELLSAAMKKLPVIYSWLGVGALFIMLWLELSGYWISVGWAILALALVLLGFVWNKRELRYQGIAVLAVTIFKVFLYDTSKLESIYRTISFMVLGVILLAASFLYNKYKEKIKRIL
ncbi:MAG: DUF2339 domain-containing protein [Patescibacteria group bacterium]|nr:DUF2339 domain-containing protein [Patescibacteria group bacterium]